MVSQEGISKGARGARRLESLDQHLLVAPAEELPALVEQPHVARGLKCMEGPLRDSDAASATRCTVVSHSSWESDFMSVCPPHHSGYLDPRVRLTLMLSQYLFSPFP